MPLKINKTNRVLYTTSVLILGTVIIVSVSGVIMLSYAGKAVPESLTLLCSVSIGALAGLFTTSGKD